MATTGVNIVQEVVICEDHLYKLRSSSGLRPFSLNYKPWRRKYFILKKKRDDNLVLEYFDQQPRSKKKPKMQLTLYPKYRVEKITNSKNRAYVFEITTPERRLCLSANEQRTMDMFVFFLQIQNKLVSQITDDYVVVHPENSETMRRIGAKGCPCILHISPWGVTLALQSSRRVLAQWPLKSIRCYESSCQGQFTLEAGRIAPMGDGLYIFNTHPGQDDELYDLLDQHVVNALQKIRPGQETSHHLEDYVTEAKRLQALTHVSVCTQHQEELPRILQESWNLILPSLESSRRTSGQSSIPPPRPEHLPNLTNGDVPPPLPTRSTTGLADFSPPSEAFVPDFRSLRLHPSHSQPALQRRPIDESNQSVPEMSSAAKRPGYLHPNLRKPRLVSQSESLPSPVEVERFSGVFESEGDNDTNSQYLTACQSPEPPTEGDADQTSNESKLRNRLKSRSCEDLNTYLKMSRLEKPDQDTTSPPAETEKVNPVEIPPVPFPRLQNLRNSLYCDSSSLTSYRVSRVYYGNVGKKSNGVYETPTAGVTELKNFFDNGETKKMRKSVSNPNFFNISSKDNSMGQMVVSPEPNNLNTNNKQKSTYRSWKNLFSDRRRKSNHDTTQNGVSHSSTGVDTSPLTDRPISKSRSSSFSRRSSQGNQAPGAAVTDTYSAAGMKGVRMTPKTRSYRRLKSESSVTAKSPVKDGNPPIASVESLC